MIIDGKKITQVILEDLKKKPAPQKKLAAIFVGNDPASASFLRQKQKTADSLGVRFELVRISEEVSEDELRVRVQTIGEDRDVGGIILQLPLPKKYQPARIIEVINPEKDVDALRPAAKIWSPIVETAKDILASINYDTSNKVIGVVGKGVLVGQPLIRWFKDKCRELIIFDTKTGLGRLGDADLILSGVGKANLIRAEALKPGAGVIDFGYALADGKLTGDLDTSGNLTKLSFYTPTPGGTGPILVAELFKNFYLLNSKY